MSARTYMFVLLCLVAVALAGCRRNIVRAAPPSVTSAPPTETPSQPQPAAPIATAEAVPPEPPAVIPVPAEPPTVKPTPPRPRPPVEPEAPKPKADSEPEPPQIAPQLSPKQLADAQRRTSADIVTAEKNLQLANGKQLNATQTDLVDKIRGFLSQAHDAIRTSDWVRAQNLAHKAQILSGELAKSL